jgi:hypothetical protein
LDAEKFHGVDVSAVVELGGKEAMAAGVAGEEGDAFAFEGAEDEGVGGIAEGGFDAEFAGVGESGHGVQAAAADYADFCEGRFCAGGFGRGFFRRHSGTGSLGCFGVRSMIAVEGRE